MEKSEVKSILIVALLFIVILLGTCEVRYRLNKPTPTGQDTLSGALYRKEKLDHIRALERQIIDLQTRNDSLRDRAKTQKQNLSLLRPRVQSYQKALTDQLDRLDSSCVQADSLRSTADSLIAIQNRADSTCIETIGTLEQLVGNRDSTLLVETQVNEQLRDLQKEQALRAQYLTEQLNTALKLQRRKTRQNKILAGSLLLLSGIMTAVLAPHYLK